MDAEAHHQETPQHEQSQQHTEQQQQPAKRRGRPLGSKNKATLAKAGTAGPLMTHVMQVQQGQDVCSTLQELAASRSCSLTVLAASGTLSAATLSQQQEPQQQPQQQQTQISGSDQEAAHVGVSLSGLFTILSITGAVLQPAILANASIQQPGQPAARAAASKAAAAGAEAAAGATDGAAGSSACKVAGGQAGGLRQLLSASLASSSGGVVAGSVAGPLVAASPVLLVVGLFG